MQHKNQKRIGDLSVRLGGMLAVLLISLAGMYFPMPGKPYMALRIGRIDG